MGSACFCPKRLLKGSDHLYVFINGKIAGTTDVAYGNDTVETKSDNMIEASKNKEDGIQKINISNALYADVSAKQNVADTRPVALICRCPVNVTLLCSFCNCHRNCREISPRQR